jgi:hypothetical protein
VHTTSLHVPSIDLVVGGDVLYNQCHMFVGGTTPESRRAEYGVAATETPLPLRDRSGAILYPGFPADDRYLFRLYSVAAQLILWVTIGLCFAPLAGRLFGSGRSAPQVAHEGHLGSSAPTEVGWPAAALGVIKRVQPMYAALAALRSDVLRQPRERGFRWRSRAVPSS